MTYSPSLSEKRAYTQQLQKAVNGLSVAAKQASRAFLLAELRWETQEIREVEAELRALRP